MKRKIQEERGKKSALRRTSFSDPKKAKRKKFVHHLWLILSICFVIIALLYLAFYGSKNVLFGKASGAACTDTAPAPCSSPGEVCYQGFCTADVDSDGIADGFIDDCTVAVVPADPNPTIIDRNGCTKAQYENIFTGIVTSKPATVEEKARLTAAIARQMKKMFT